MEHQQPEEEEEFYQSIEEQFLDACRYNQETLGELLAEPSLDFTYTNQQNNNCLHMAAGNGHINVLNKVLEEIKKRNLKDKSLIIDKQNADGNTPLHYAVLAKNLELVNMLINEGAKTNIKNDTGRTPLKEAIEFSTADIAEALAKVTDIEPEDLQVEEVADVEGGNQKIEEEDIGEIQRGMEIIEIDEGEQYKQQAEKQESL